MERWLNEAKEGRHDGQMSATVIRNARCSLVAGIEAIEASNNDNRCVINAVRWPPGSCECVLLGPCQLSPTGFLQQ